MLTVRRDSQDRVWLASKRFPRFIDVSRRLFDMAASNDLTVLRAYPMRVIISHRDDQGRPTGAQIVVSLMNGHAVYRVVDFGGPHVEPEGAYFGVVRAELFMCTPGMSPSEEPGLRACRVRRDVRIYLNEERTQVYEAATGEKLLVALSSAGRLLSAGVGDRVGILAFMTRDGRPYALGDQMACERLLCTLVARQDPQPESRRFSQTLPAPAPARGEVASSRP